MYVIATILSFLKYKGKIKKMAVRKNIVTFLVNYFKFKLDLHVNWSYLIEWPSKKCSIIKRLLNTNS